MPPLCTLSQLWAGCTTCISSSFSHSEETAACPHTRVAEALCCNWLGDVSGWTSPVQKAFSYSCEEEQFWQLRPTRHLCRIREVSDSSVCSTLDSGGTSVSYVLLPGGLSADLLSPVSFKKHWVMDLASTEWENSTKPLHPIGYRDHIQLDVHLAS